MELIDLSKIKSTKEIKVPARLIDQVIGQEKAVEIVKKAAAQRRNVLLIGEPGTGKSMLAQAMAELLPQEELEDILVYPNELDENTPKVRVVKTYPKKEDIEADEELKEIFRNKNLLENQRRQMLEEMRRKGFYVDDARVKGTVGCGRLLIEYHKQKKSQRGESGEQQQKRSNPWLMFFIFFLIVLIVITSLNQGEKKLFEDMKSTDIILIVMGLMSFFIFFLMIYFFYNFISSVARRPLMGSQENLLPKLLIDNSGRVTAPFIDATGAKAGALLGDVKHDPLQSGGLGTPAHLRVEAGAIHRAHKGVLFIDEISSLKMTSQQELLTAMQEKRYSITGQSELSSGALVKTEPVPCDFVLVAAGNVIDVQNMHPALRSRIRGAGYEVYVNDMMEDTPENVSKIVRFIAQEVVKDQKIPHFDVSAIERIITEARRMAGRKGKLTLKLRELGGIVRAAGDIAKSEGAQLVNAVHVEKALAIALPFEMQLAKKYTEYKKEYSVFTNRGYAVGKVNGLAVLGTSAGIITPIVAEVTPAGSRAEGKVIATGKLGEIAKESVQNVSALIKKYLGKNTADYDIHIQFLQTYEGVEGDSASISIAVSVISALEEIPVNQEFALTGSLSVRGEVLPVGGVTTKTEAAIEAGITNVIIPKANSKDLLLTEENSKKINIHTTQNIVEVLRLVLKECKKKKELLKKMESNMD